MSGRPTESRPGSCYLRSTCAVSLNERFSQVLIDQLSNMVTFDPVCDPPVVLLVNRDTSSLQAQRPSVGVQHLRKRRSVWARLGWRLRTRTHPASRSTGFWSFRNKYRRRVWSTSGFRSGAERGGLGARRTLMRRNLQRLTAGRLHLHPQRAAVSRGRGLSAGGVPTKKQLDVQLDEYMSMSKSRLDKQLDEYMSMSKRRLDAQLDEYMLMAGQTGQLWD